VTWGQANSTYVPPNQKVNKAEQLTYFYIKIESTLIQLLETLQNVIKALQRLTRAKPAKHGLYNSFYNILCLYLM
jgi:hypothetical protein